ncbi:MAG: UDP-N-acetylmuramoyl-L-alanyl-D-glutamate--2,6-diaminopimelate ligase [Aerococcus sp.]|nr:UDP-N-acetylmuramoyl-L-alanyl-D-glutamate--2,6-diaminopimelate ligase [Aerococcus sp.]
MDLKTLVTYLADQHLLVDNVGDLDGQEVQALAMDSRAVGAGTLFFCKGAQFKADYLKQAVKQGAIAYVSETHYDVPIPGLIVSDIRRVMPTVANHFYDRPWQAYPLIGVTGTKGKTTTVYYIRQILDAWSKQQQKHRSGLISSATVYVGEEEVDSQLTTPESLPLYQLLQTAANHQLPYVTMEVSSQALKYHRTDGILYDTVAFLNISKDHISPVEHPTFEDYFSSKLKLFQQGKRAVINADMDHVERVLATAEQSPTVEAIHTFSTKNPRANYYAKAIVSQPTGESFTLVHQSQEYPMTLAMSGAFNVENALAAIAITHGYGVPVETIQHALSQATVPGRMESFHTKDEKIVAMVDYAHNQVSFEAMFDTSDQIYPDHAVGVVFGSPGKKAYNRRQDLTAVAGKRADRIVLTTEDPGKEDPASICQEMLQYVENQTPRARAKATVEVDRGKAIQTLFDWAEQLDTPAVLWIAGKGDELEMKYQNGLEPYFGDHNYVKQAIAAYNQRH